MAFNTEKYGLKNPVTQGLLLFIIGVFLYVSALMPNKGSDVKSFNRVFKEKVNYLEGAIEDFSNTVNYGDQLSVIWNNTRKFRNIGYEYFVFHHDSLLYWTSNHVSLEENHYSESKRGIVLLENGWYYKTVRNAGDYAIVGLFLIKHEFPYENDNLANIFNPEFGFDYRAKISQSPDDVNITFPDGELAFSLTELTPNRPGALWEMAIIFTFLFSLLKISYGLWKRVSTLRSFSKIQMYLIGILGVLGIRLLLFWQDWKGFFEGFELFDPNIFASSDLIPTPIDLAINILTILILTELVVKLAERFFEKVQFSGFWSGFVFCFSLALFFVISHFSTSVISEVIFNSDVPLDFYNFMSLSPISFVFLAIFFAVLWFYFRSTEVFVVLPQKLRIPINQKGLFWFLLAAFFALVEIFFYEVALAIGVIPVLLSFLLIFYGAWRKRAYKFTKVVGLLILYTFYLSLVINNALDQKELASREIYAKKLISEKELETELEFAYTSDLIQNSSTLQQFFKNPDLLQAAQIKRYLEKKYFQGYWNRYEIDFYLYDADTLPISTYVQLKDDPADMIDGIINKVGVASDVSDFIYYVSDFSDNLSYVARQPIRDSLNQNLGFIYLGMRSKVIPQEIGFPRLLLNDYSKVFFKLENYDMAKYVRGKLALRYGSYNFPLAIGSFLLDLPQTSGVVHDGDYVHLISHGESNKTIILTKDSIDFEEYFTTFSFLFSTFGLILIFSMLVSGNFVNRWKTMKLAFRIQLLFVALVFFSLLFSGIGTGAYVKNQFLDYQESQLREKVSSVQKELHGKLENEDNLDEVLLTNYLEYLLNEFSSVFVADINLYNAKGKLLASSRPEIFNLGLLSPQMNARAFRQMYNLQLSLYVNSESIGNQDYLSAYVPLINVNNKVVAYINLPYFAKQSDFDSEIAGFLSSIINIFVLLFALSIVIAVFITSKIVDPLKQIQESLSGLKLGKSQQPILYNGKDEIGVLVQEYNKKLEELQESSEKLAKSEREMAWREMAKQVAHEIKNPLTPMKLRIQHFQRSFDPNADNAEERIQKFADSLIEQIDALTNIANAFSNFAKMPKAIFETVDVVRVLQNAVETFSSEENVEVSFEKEMNSLSIQADKELLLRVFNNLIKNAVQAIPPGGNGEVHVVIAAKQDWVLVQVQDNGIGISEEMRDKIFVPNFTTKSTGTGLGLAMVKQIIESHNGEISFESQPGNTIFKIQLPYKQQ